MSVSRALVLAGARPGPDPLAEYAGVAAKPLIEVGGVPMLARVVRALQAAGVGEIAVSTSDAGVAALAHELGAKVLAAEAGPSLSTLRAVEAFGVPLLVTTADHALLEPQWVRRFLEDAPADADVCVLLARREAIEATAPGTRRTYLRFADGAWSGCNLFLMQSERALGAIRLWRTLEADRKSPWRIVRRLGPVTLARYLAGRLTLAEALARLGALSGARAAVVESPFGLAAVDVDKPADLDLVRDIVGS
jgi:GTP:adenosylcobinamide-phosphate guanylyltransferase